MENDNFKVKVLTDKEKQFLKSKTPAFLPDNPSDKRFSASQIKRAMYEGYLILFDWIKDLAEDVNAANSNIGDMLISAINYNSKNITVEDTDYIIPLEDR